MARGRKPKIIYTGNEPQQLSGFNVGDDGTIVVDPGDVDRLADTGNGNTGNGVGSDGDGSGGTGSGSAPRKRGRQPGTTSKKASLDVSAFTGLLVGFHGILAQKVPELEMDSDDAERITLAANQVLRHYKLGATQKAIDIAAFVMIAGAFYVPRVGIAIARTRGEKQVATPRSVTPQPRSDLPVTPPLNQNIAGPRIDAGPMVMGTDGEFLPDGRTQH